jgi:hypothetical protein
MRLFSFVQSRKEKEPMMRAIGLYTYELDNINVVVAEIQARREAFPLMKRTVGVITRDPEYIDSGIYEAVCAGEVTNRFHNYSIIACIL